jgi:small subunit ribosomal protein S6
LRTYEGMYIFDPAAATDWSNVEDEVKRLMNRAGAELIICNKWDERRLAYEIKGRKRGCYVLTYFKAPSAGIATLERDAQLSEKILRVLFLRADGLTREQMESPPAPGSDSIRGRGGDRWETEGRGGRRRERRPWRADEGERTAERGSADDAKRAEAGMPEADEATPRGRERDG